MTKKESQLGDASIMRPQQQLIARISTEEVFQDKKEQKDEKEKRIAGEKDVAPRGSEEVGSEISSEYNFLPPSPPFVGDMAAIVDQEVADIERQEGISETDLFFSSAEEELIAQAAEASRVEELRGMFSQVQISFLKAIAESEQQQRNFLIKYIPMFREIDGMWSDEMIPTVKLMLDKGDSLKAMDQYKQNVLMHLCWHPDRILKLWQMLAKDYPEQFREAIISNQSLIDNDRTVIGYLLRYHNSESPPRSLVSKEAIIDIIFNVAGDLVTKADIENLMTIAGEDEAIELWEKLDLEYNKRKKLERSQDIKSDLKSKFKSERQLAKATPLIKHKTHQELIAEQDDRIQDVRQNYTATDVDEVLRAILWKELNEKEILMLKLNKISSLYLRREINWKFIKQPQCKKLLMICSVGEDFLGFYAEKVFDVADELIPRIYNVVLFDPRGPESRTLKSDQCLLLKNTIAKALNIAEKEIRICQTKMQFDEEVLEGAIAKNSGPFIVEVMSQMVQGDMLMEESGYLRYRTEEDILVIADAEHSWSVGGKLRQEQIWQLEQEKLAWQKEQKKLLSEIPLKAPEVQESSEKKIPLTESKRVEKAKQLADDISSTDSSSSIITCEEVEIVRQDFITRNPKPAAELRVSSLPESSLVEATDSPSSSPGEVVAIKIHGIIGKPSRVT